MKVTRDSKGHRLRLKRIYFILHNELNIKKLSARWVLRCLLTAEQKQIYIRTSADLEVFKKNPTNFIRHFKSEKMKITKRNIDVEIEK